MQGIGWVDSAQDRDYWMSPCECDIEPPGSISHGVSFVYIYMCIFVSKLVLN